MGELLGLDGVDLPTRMRARFHTQQRDEAVESVERLYGPHSLELESRAGLDMRLAGFDVGQLNVSSIEYGCPATAHTPQPSDHWVFSIATRGEIMVGDRIARAGDAGVRAPHETADVPMSAALRLVNLKVPGAALDDAWRALFGAPAERAPCFLGLAPAGSAPTLLLARLVRRLDEAPAYPAPYAALLERRLQEATLLELLLAWPHSQSARLERAAASSRGSTERALDYIHANAADVPTLAEIAHAAGVGVRALTRGFEKRLGVSPMRYQLLCRLDRARADLRDARPGAGVTEIALRWGFGNLGDFAARYRERFGELPRASLRRGG